MRFKLFIDGKFQGGSFTETDAKALAAKLRSADPKKKIEIVAKDPKKVGVPAAPPAEK